MHIDNWIYVTGTPRGGTTFTGLTLSRPISVDYIHEPFNPECGIPGITTRYLYVRKGMQEEPAFHQTIERLMSYDFSLNTGYYDTDTKVRRMVKHVVGSRGPFHLRLAKLNPFHRAAVVKDPVGCFLADYLASEFGFKTVALIRHPVAFVASVRRVKWDAETHFRSLGLQHQLRSDYFSEEPGFLDSVWASDVETAAALWRGLTKVLVAQARNNPSIRLVTHEELSRRPLEIFRELYRDFGLPWSARIERRIVKQTGAGNRSEAKVGRVQDFNRDSASLLELRMMQLSEGERRRIWEITGDVASSLYSQGSFAI